MKPNKTHLSAFPVPEHVEAPGMDLRDYFAGQIITGMIAGQFAEIPMFKSYAKDAYTLADEMMLARLPEQPDPTQGPRP